MAICKRALDTSTSFVGEKPRASSTWQDRSSYEESLDWWENQLPRREPDPAETAELGRTKHYNEE